MKILWLVNVILPQIADSIGCEVQPIGGWLIKLSQQLTQTDGIELTVVFPQNFSNSIVKGETEHHCIYYGFPTKRKASLQYNKKEEVVFKQILINQSPDIVHIWGTEYIHSLEMFMAFDNPNRCIISLQGIISYYSKYYLNGLPSEIKYFGTVRDIFRNDLLWQQKRRFEKRGTYEKKLLQKAQNVIGRTDWDKAICEIFNPRCNYYKCNEILRESFYEGKWSYNNCEKYSIFVSQGNYPIKGLHYIIEAIAELAIQFPSIKLYVAGSRPYQDKSFFDKARRSGYGRYIRRLIHQNHLENNIVFLGSLSEKEMRNRLLISHVFAMPSTIENSPNSLGEAMLLGVPSVAADVGGINSMLNHKTEGLLYQSNAPYMLAYYIKKLFSDDTLCNAFSRAAEKRARETFDIDNNVEDYMNVYRTLLIS